MDGVPLHLISALDCRDRGIVIPAVVKRGACRHETPLSFAVNASHDER